MAFKTRLFLALIGLALTACHGSKNEASEESRSIQMPEMTKEIKLPTKLWDQVTGASFEKSVRQSSSLLFAPIVVRMVEKTPGVLGDPSLKLEFPKGGGELDFAKYIKAEKGTFQLYFDLEPMQNPESLKIFYVSKARKRKIDNEIYGAGCKSFFDIKDYIVKVSPKEGISLNVTRDRHDSAMGGHFVFSYQKDKQIYVSQVTFTDSRRLDLFCESTKK